MRKIIFIAFLLIFSSTSFSQQTSPPASLTKSDYLKKSKKQNTAAWILLGGGFACTTTGLILGINGVTEEIAGIFTGEQSNTFEAGAVLFYTGLASMLGSIPFFIASTNNKRKANNLSASFKIENGSYLYKASMIKTGYPAIAVKIKF